MRYKNIKTGAIIDSPSKFLGNTWVELDKTKESKPVKEVEYVDEEVNLNDMTKTELIELAKDNDIEVNERDTKPVIIEALVKAFE